MAPLSPLDPSMEILNGVELLLPRSEAQGSPPIAQLRLKRLKKASSRSSRSPGLSEAGISPDLDGSEAKMEVVGGLDPLFGDPVVSETLGARDFEEEEEWVGGIGYRSGKEKSAKKRLSWGGDEDKDSKKKKKKKQKRNESGEGGKPEEEGPTKKEQKKSESSEGRKPEEDGSTKKKQKKSGSSGGGKPEEEGPKKKKKKRNKSESGEDGKPKESVREKRYLEKERKAHLEQIHADSQRLLRETRNASFKPVPHVQKPISSVLEKIRNRKLEVLKRTSISLQSYFFADAGSSMEEMEHSSNIARHQNNGKDLNKDTVVDCEAPVVVVGNYDAPLGSTEEIPSDKPLDGSLQDTLHTANSDSAHVHSPLTNGENSDERQTDDNLDGILGDSPVPSLPNLSLNHEPAAISSSPPHEDSDEENIGPSACEVDKTNFYLKTGLAKTFLDDEAEEEDDSDHDLVRFQGNEEDDSDESDENEVLNDLIASGYEEAPIDHEKRNQLHQKWLEQQDAAETDNVLQRLKRGSRKNEPSILHDEECDEECDDDSDEDVGDEAPYSQVPTNVLRQNSKRVKHMMAQMFTDENDVYVPSDDEETEKNLMRQHLLKQNEEESPFITPLEDEHSREVFGLIKKSNIAHNSRKKGKTVTSTFDMLSLRRNSNSSSKSSFLGRAQSSSLLALRRQGSTTVRTFIFGRDDSNSKSSVLASENFSDMDQKENQPSRTTKVTFCSSQSKSTILKAKAEAQANTGSSLFQILKNSSIEFDKRTRSNESNNLAVLETQAVYQFSAFKLGRKFSRSETRN